MGWSRAFRIMGFAACVALASDSQSHAQPRDRERPIRVGNSNVFFAGGGYGVHDHPTFDSNGFTSST